MVSEPVELELTPNSELIGVDFIDSTFEWRIIKDYQTLPEGDGLNVGGYGTSVPILFFPAPGTGLLRSQDHPCILSPGPCCLFDFAEQYTTVAFYDRLVGMAATFNRDNCANFGDFRPVVESLHGDDSLILDALRGIPNATVAFRGEPSADSVQQIEIRINHREMDRMLATTVQPQNHTGSTRLYTYVGILWLRTLPTASVHQGLEVFVAQPRIVLDPSPLVVVGAAVAGASNCTLTPQGRCVICSNELPDHAYFIFTNETSGGVCEFRCFRGATYAPTGGPGGTPTCELCRVLDCPDGQYASECTPTVGSECRDCTNPEEGECPAVGFYRELCRGGAQVNGGCVQCDNAPDYATYTRGCEWECPFGYMEVFGFCVLLPPGQAMVTVELFVGNVFPEGGAGEGEAAMRLDVVTRSVASFVTGLDADGLFVIGVERVDGTVKPDPWNVKVVETPSAGGVVQQFGRRVRNLLQSDQGFFTQGTKLDMYFWLPAATATDPVQELIDSVRAPYPLERLISRDHGVEVIVAFLVPPQYRDRGEGVRELRNKGVEPRGDGAVGIDETTGLTPEELDVLTAGYWSLPYILVAICSAIITWVVAGL